MNVTNVWRGLAALVFVTSVVGIAFLTFRYLRNPVLAVYGFTGGSGQLWLTLVAITSFLAFLILPYEEQQNKKKESGP